jgi:two-component system phosphate regulon response regulator PhoB
MQASVLIVEDEPAIRQMVRFALDTEGLSCAEAGDADQAGQAIARQQPDLILLDWMLPGISGIEFARRLRHDPRTSQIPIIMLTARGEEQDRIRGLDTAADDYVTKPFSMRELMSRIRAVLRRTSQPAPEETTRIGDLCIDSRTHRATVQGQPLPLSPTEFRLLQFFATHPERVYTRSQLLDSVWGKDAYIDERTVDVHIRRLRKVLSAGNMDRHIQTVRSVGYRFSTAEA